MKSFIYSLIKESWRCCLSINELYRFSNPANSTVLAANWNSSGLSVLPLDCLEEGFLDIVGPEENIINTLRFLGMCVTISSYGRV